MAEIGAHAMCQRTWVTRERAVQDGANWFVIDIGPHDIVGELDSIEVFARRLLSTVEAEKRRRPSVHVAVVEYHDGDGDTGKEPDVYVGTSWREVALAAGAVMKDSTGYDQVDEFLEEAPWPGPDALDDGLRNWFEGYHEATTVPWVSFFERPVLG